MFFTNIVRNFAALVKYNFSMLRYALCFTILLTFSSFNVGNAVLFYESGMAHLSKQNFIGAISDFTHAISINPQYKEAYYQRATAKLLLEAELRMATNDIFDDLLKAKELGDSKAVKLLLKKAQMECYTINAKLDSDNEVFCLDYENADLSQIPAHTYGLSSLLSLHLSHNKIAVIHSLQALNNLLILSIDNNELITLPSTVGMLSSLVELNASNNYISSLPQEITQLHNLRVLYLRGNQLAELPTDMDRLESLEVLDLSLNKLKEIPANLFKIKKLKTLYLTGNDFKEKDILKLKQQLPNTVIYF